MFLSAILLGLMAIPALFVIAFIFGEYNADRTRRTLRSLRLATSLMVVVIAGVMWSSGIMPTIVPLFFCGMLLGFIGDLILAQVIRTPNRIIFGLLPFAIGHLCYVIGFMQAASSLHLTNPLTGTIVWSIYVIVAALLWVMFINNPAKPRALNLGSLIYAWLISVMAGTAAGLAIQDARFTLTAVGGLLFFISDLILGNRELRDHAWFLVHDVVWIIYIAGQALIVLTPLYR
jgi:hypothetical protein